MARSKPQPDTLLGQLAEGGRLVAFLQSGAQGRATLYLREHGQVGQSRRFRRQCAASGGLQETYGLHLLEQPLKCRSEMVPPLLSPSGINFIFAFVPATVLGFSPISRPVGSSPMSSPQHEPTMEEILASIRKIISEDARKPRPLPQRRQPAAEAAKQELLQPPAEPEIDVLELTQEVVEPAPASPSLPMPSRPRPTTSCSSASLGPAASEA